MDRQYNPTEGSRLGNLLVDKGWLSLEQLAQALSEQSASGKKLGEVLIEHNLITRAQLTRVLCRQKWLRSALASVCIAAAPVCPVLASDSGGKTDVMQKTRLVVDIDKIEANGPNFQSIENEKDQSFRLGIQHHFSSSSGLEFSMNSYPINNSFAEPDNRYRLMPQISLFSSEDRPKQIFQLAKNNQKTHRFDRYKDSIPAIYRLTLKGYTLYEQDDKQFKTWGLDRVKDHPCKEYEIMFSITKKF